MSVLLPSRVGWFWDWSSLYFCVDLCLLGTDLVWTWLSLLYHHLGGNFHFLYLLVLSILLFLWWWSFSVSLLLLDVWSISYITSFMGSSFDLWTSWAWYLEWRWLHHGLNRSFLLTIWRIVDKMLADFLFMTLVDVVLYVKVQLFVPELLVPWLSNSCIFPLVYLEIVPDLKMLHWVSKFHASRLFSIELTLTIDASLQVLVRHIYLHLWVLSCPCVDANLLLCELFQHLLQTNDSRGIFLFLLLVLALHGSILLSTLTWSLSTILLLDDSSTCWFMAKFWTLLFCEFLFYLRRKILCQIINGIV